MTEPKPELDDWAPKLIRLKRYESPGSDYFDRFLEDFHERQRAEPLRISVWTLAWDRLLTWWRGFPLPVKLAAASGLFAGLLLFAWPRGSAAELPETVTVPREASTLAEVSVVREF